MASQVEGWIGRINPGDGLNYAIGSTAYGVCETAAATSEKIVDMTGFTLTNGATIHVWFKNGNSASNPSLNVNGTGAKNIVAKIKEIIVEGQFVYLQDVPNNLVDLDSGSVLEFTYCKGYWVLNTAVNIESTIQVSINSYITSLPFTANVAEIDTHYVVARMTLTNPDAQIDDWTVTTKSGSFTINGIISGSTKAVIVFVRASLVGITSS